MKVKLIITGGPLGRTRSGSVDTDLTPEEYESLCRQLSRKKPDGGPDAFSYFLQKENARTRRRIYIQNIPAKYNDLFGGLFKKLKYEK